MEKKSLKDISWQVTEPEYREDPALSYSTLAKYERTGFNGLEHLFDKVESPSLTFGSAVDSIITGGQEEFDDRFIVAEFPECPDAIIKVVRELFSRYAEGAQDLYEIDTDDIISVAMLSNYQSNWKPETRAKVIREKGNEYYKLMYIAESKTILSTEMYEDVQNSVKALKESKATKWYFEDNNPFNTDLEHLYQLKFKATLNGVDYRCMADELIVDHKNKIVYPIDLKTSSHTEWDFFKSFVDWCYHIQARLYWRIIRDNMDRDPYFKDFKLANYKFIVVNKKTLTPLVWEFTGTQMKDTLCFGKQLQIQFRDPEEIGQELHQYLSSRPAVPNGIETDQANNIEQWLMQL